MPTVTECALLAAFALLTGCGELPTVPAGAVPLDPPEHFRALWAETERCAGHERPFAAVRWYQVPDAWEVVGGDGRPVQAYYDLGADHIVLAGAYLNSDPLVKHEALHAILDRPGHPAEFDRCNLRLTD